MRNKSCTACPLHTNAKNVCIDGYGPIDADILVVGQAPGRTEDREGKPFVGPTGKLLKSELAKAGLSDLKIRYTNTVRCYPPSDRMPTAKEVKACLGYLESEIAMVRPEYVITAGSLATKAVLKKASVTTTHGQIIADSQLTKAGHSFTGYPVFHPAATFRDPSKLTVIQQDFARLKRQIDGTLGATQKAFKYRVVTDHRALKEFLRAFKTAEDYAYDTETNSLFLRARDFKVRSIAFALPDMAWVIPLEMTGSLYEGNWQAQRAVLSYIADRVEDKWCTVFHGKFDSGALRAAYSVTLPYHFDAMLAHYFFDENQDHDLKYVSRVELDCEEYDIPKELKLSDTPLWLQLMKLQENREKYWKYNAQDAWNTLQLSYKFSKRLRTNPAMRRLHYELAMPSSRALESIEAEGLPVDHAKYDEMETQTGEARDVAVRALNKRAGEVINWNSWQQVGRILYDKLKLPVQQRTPTGGPSTSEESVVDLKGKHPIIDELLHYRKLDKILGTYLQGWRQYIEKDRIYFSYKQPGTVTGRFSSRLHQIPTDGDIRSIIAANKDDEWDFVAADLSQAELRIAAEMSGDVSLIDAYREGRDVHWDTVLFMIAAGHMDEYTEQAFNTARALRKLQGGKNAITSMQTLQLVLNVLQIAGVDKCKAVWDGWKEARNCAKRINFGFLYGMYEKTFIKKAKVDYDWYCTWKQAHGFRTGFFELRRGLEPWHSRCKRIARIDGYVTNMFGRVRRLPAIQSSDKDARMEAERQAVNAPVQGTIGDWKSAAMVEIHETIDSAKYKLCGEHHDALLGRVRKGHEDDVLPKVRRIMERPRLLKTFKIKMQVPMSVDIAVGAWGKGYTYHDPK